MKSKMPSYTLDALPPLGDAELERLKTLSLLSDEEIDTSDIPELTPEQLKRFFPASLRRFVRTHLMTQVDEEVIAWLREKGDGADEYVNSLLRGEMQASNAKRKQAA